MAISGPNLQGLNNYILLSDILLSALAHLRDDGSAQLPNVEKSPYHATDEA
jgi:hypothetical protein